MNAESAAARRRGVRILGVVFLAVFVLVAALGLTVYFGLNVTPDYRAQQQARIDALSDREREAISVSLRNRLLTEWSDPGEAAIEKAEDMFGRRRTLEIPYEQLNVWLAEEGIDLLAEVGVELPRAVKGAMVDSPGGGLLRVSCDLERGGTRQVVALVFDIAVDDDGIVTSRLDGASAGRLPIPAQMAVDQIARRAESDRVLHLMQGTPVGPIELPIDASENGRDGRLVGLEVRDDVLVVTRETVPRLRPNE